MKFNQKDDKGICMKHQNSNIVLVKCLIVILAVIGTSFLSVKVWQDKAETIHQTQSLIFDENMTIGEFGEKNNLHPAILKDVFSLKTKADLKKRLGNLSDSRQDIMAKINKSMALQAERESKNWIKIFIKFGCWIVFLGFSFFLLRRSGLTNRSRIALYTAAVVIFGVIFGADPSPMGTIKDAIVLFGSKRVLFPPRMIALAVFLLMVIIANKFICSWGCQFGTLQDLLFRMNRGDKDKPILTQLRIPFKVSNFFRIVFFILFTVLAIGWAFDIVAPMDPFKIFKPDVLAVTGFVYVGVMLIASIFVYRPWCHLFCPFGLVGWIAERTAFFKIKVDYDTCISCEACSRACPSTVMDAILKRDRIIPDCFSCGSCIEVCPVKAIHFHTGKRDFPPAGKFDKKMRQSPVNDAFQAEHQHLE